MSNDDLAGAQQSARRSTGPIDVARCPSGTKHRRRLVIGLLCAIALLTSASGMRASSVVDA